VGSWVSAVCPQVGFSQEAYTQVGFSQEAYSLSPKDLGRYATNLNLAHRSSDY
jgi:hypothetical protein